MKKFLLIILVIATLFSITSCAASKSVSNAIWEIGTSTEQIDQSNTYDLDEEFKCFQLFNIGGEGVLHLNAETGILSIKFKSSQEKEDGSVDCTVTGLYLQNVGTISFGWLENVEIVKTYIGENLVFTLYVNENNVVTSDNLPTLLPQYVK